MTRNDIEPHGAHGEFAEVLSALEPLAQSIDAERFPGEAWSAPLARRRVLRWLGAGAAAAAIVLLALAGGYWFGARGRDPHAPAGPTQVAGKARAVQATQPATETRVDPAIAARVPWTVPRISVPSTVDANGLHIGWCVPTMAFPSFQTYRRPAATRTTSQPKPT